MKRNHRPLVIGNWKMNPQSEAQAITLAKAVVAATKRQRRSVDVGIAVPFPFLSAVAKITDKAGVTLLAQDMSPEPQGAFTGSVAAKMLKSVGVKAVIVGHSERRLAGMHDKQVAAVLDAALKERLAPVLCIGERERDTRGDFYGVIESQLGAALAAVPRTRLKDITIAYEPVWAIGTGKNAEPEDVEEMKLFIQKTLVNRFGRAAATLPRILYGGSVTQKNVEALATTAQVDGFLVGGASLVPTEFTTIVSTTLKHAH